MREFVATASTSRKRVTNQAVTYALRSLDSSVQRLERVVLRPEKAQSKTARKSENAPKR
jgi:hypothetical protein